MIDFHFEDISNFACNLQDFPSAQKPNHTARHEQFVYGTNPVAGQGIPNLYIKVGTAQTIVYLTNASGNPVPNLWTVDPVTGGAVAPYSTVSTYFEGPVVKIPVDAISGVYALNDTYPISFNGIGTVVNDQFQVTVRNWNICNPWNGSQTNPNSAQANLGMSRIFIIDAPPAPTVPNRTICFGDNRTLTVTSPVVGTIHWYSDAGLTTEVGTGTFYTPAQTAVGSYNFWVTDQSLTGLLCMSPSTMVTLTINPIPDQPTVTRNNPDFCFNGTSSIILTADSHAPPAVSSYQWYRNGNPVGGATTSTITLSTVAQSGDYTVRTYGIAPSNCPSPLSAVTTVVIGDPATVNAGPATAIICSNIVYNTAGTFGGGASSVTWTTSGNGTFGDTSDPTTTYTFGSTEITSGTVTLTLTTNNPTGPCNAVSDNIVITVRRAPSANAGPDAAICQGSTYTVSGASASNYASIAWTENGAGSITAGGATLTPTYTPAVGDYGNTVTLTLTAVGNAPCANTSDAKLLYIDRTPTASVGPAQNICNSTTATLSGNSPAFGATGLWTFPSIWKEDFTGLADGTTSDAGPTSWSRTISLSGGGWYSEVRSQKYELRYNRTVWTSGTINISAFTNVGISVDFSSYATGNGFETPQDYIQARAIVDGTPTTFFNITGAVDGSTGAGSLALRTVKATASNLNGNNLVIEITLYNSAADEYFQFDNVTVTNGSTPLITDPTNPTSTVTNLPIGNTTFTWTVSSAHNGCAPASANLLLRVYPQFTAAQLYDNASICSGATTNFNIAMTGGTSPYTVNYTKNGVAQAPLVNYISGTNISTGPLLINTTYVLTSVTDANGCSALSLGNSILITVGSVPTAATLTGSGDICVGASASWIRSVITGGAPPYTIKYTRNAVAQPDITNYTSGTNYNLAVLPVGAYTYQITQITDACGANVLGGGLPGPYTININAFPNAAATVNNTPAICNNGTTDIILHADVTNSDFIWTVSNAPAVTWQPAKAPAGGTRLNGENTSIAQNLEHTATFPTTVTYTITPRGPGATACLGAAITRNVIVYPTPILTSSLTPPAICSNTAFSYTPTSATAGTTFNWNRATVSGITPVGPTSGMNNPNETLINTTANPIVVTYAYTLTADGCTNVQNVTVTVNPAPALATLDATKCSDEALGFNLSVAAGSVAASTYNITAINTGGLTASAGAPATGNGFAADVISDDAWTNTTAAPVNVVYTVVPVSASGCLGNSRTITITVNPEPTLATLNATRCSDEVLGFNLSVAAGSVAASTYNITAINAGGLTASAGAPAIGNGLLANVIADDAWTNTTAAPVNVIYTVIPVSAATCQGNSKTITITVNPEPTLATLDASRCSDAALGINLSVAAGSVAASTYNITAINTGGLTASAGAPATGNGLAANVIADDAWTNTTSASVNVIYTVVPVSAAGCQGNSKTITITVTPEPVITPGQTLAACSGNALNYQILLNNFVNPAGNVTFTWLAPVLNPVNPGFTGGTARPVPSSANITDTFTNTMGVIGTATYTVTPYKDGCAGTPATVVVSIGAEPILDPNLSKFACNDQAINLTLKEAPGSVTPTYYNIVSKTVSAGLTESGNAAIPNGTAPANYLINDKYTNTTGVNKTVTYRVQPILAPDCYGDFVDVVITIRPLISAGAIAGNASTCYNTDAPAITNMVLASGGDGLITYSWYYTENLAAVPGDANWTLIAGATGSGYDPGVLTNPTKYVRKAVDVSCPDVVYTNVITITINPLPVTSVISGPSVLCEDATNKVYQVVNTPGSTYSWTVPASLNITSPAGLYFIIVDAVPGMAVPGDKITVTETFTSTTVVQAAG